MDLPPITLDIISVDSHSSGSNSPEANGTCGSCGQSLIPFMTEPNRVPQMPYNSDHIAEECSKRLHGAWANSELITVNQISGGLSNYLYLCSLPDDVPLATNEPNKVLVRIYGQILMSNADSVVVDALVFALLSEKKFGPKLFGVFHGGRVEQYIVSRALTTRELCQPAVSRQIAGTLRNLHRQEMPLKKQPVFLLNAIGKWMRALDHCTDPKTLELMSTYRIEEEFAWIREVFRTKVADIFPVVFCHNDLQENNILYLEAPDSEDGFLIKMIDFEYSSYNYRAFDFGNHFMEWCYDYVVDKAPYFEHRPDEFPTEEEQLRFWNAYKEGEDNTSDDELFLLEVKYGAVLSNFFWGVWSLVQNQLSEIQFGFIEHGESRLQEYLNRKECLPPLTK